MKFKPSIHTKDFLLAHPDYLQEIIKTDPDFLSSPLAHDIDILKHKIDREIGDTAAHVFALNNKDWLHTDAAKNLEILKLANKSKRTVAHILASKHPEWGLSDAAKNYDILLLKNDFNWTVAHNLAEISPQWLASDAAKDEFILTYTSRGQKYTVAHVLASTQKDWLTSDAAQKLEILKLRGNSGETVAYELLEHAESVNHKPLFDKKMLYMVMQGKTLAELVIKKLSTQTLVPQVAINLISQGIAYKRFNYVSCNSGKVIYDQSLDLIEACSDHRVKFVYLSALYSTMFHMHNFELGLARDEDEKNFFESKLRSAENLFRTFITENPKYLRTKNKIELFCEPSDALLTQLINEYNFKDTIEIERQSIENTPPANQISSIY